MSGCEVTGGSRDGVDVFFTDPTYATTNLVVTRVKTASGFNDVTVDCAGPLTGWQPLGTSEQFEFTNVDLVRATKAVAGCQNGPHLATSAGPFGLLVWGLDKAASYSYPAGGSFRAINSVVLLPIPR
jgi:hypothetical protein